jgi:hypothetical protein
MSCSDAPNNSGYHRCSELLPAAQCPRANRHGDGRNYAISMTSAGSRCGLTRRCNSEADPTWATECAVACYDCLLSYSNQPHHPRIDRQFASDTVVQHHPMIHACQITGIGRITGIDTMR